MRAKKNRRKQSRRRSAPKKQRRARLRETFTACVSPNKIRGETDHGKESETTLQLSLRNV
ncbi:MAG: hypothetical protein H3C30_00855 [Candidatus Hydrogenedentes bacterium]|nr:hypothetical protein [Candidatus Hydrogenedentota bacterium]